MCAILSHWINTFGGMFNSVYSGWALNVSKDEECLDEECFNLPALCSRPLLWEGRNILVPDWNYLCYSDSHMVLTPSLWPRTAWLDLLCSPSCYLIKDSNWFFSSSGWANPIVLLCPRPLTVVLPLHRLALICQGVNPRSLDLDTGGPVGQSDSCQKEGRSHLPWAPGHCVGAMGWVWLPPSAMRAQGTCCQLLLPKLSVAFLQSQSSLGCPSACPAVWFPSPGGLWAQGSAGSVWSPWTHSQSVPHHLGFRDTLWEGVYTTSCSLSSGLLAFHIHGLRWFMNKHILHRHILPEAW